MKWLDEQDVALANLRACIADRAHWLFVAFDPVGNRALAGVCLAVGGVASGTTGVWATAFLVVDAATTLATRVAVLCVPKAVLPLDALRGVVTETCEGVEVDGGRDLLVLSKFDNAWPVMSFLTGVQDNTVTAGRPPQN